MRERYFSSPFLLGFEHLEACSNELREAQETVPALQYRREGP